MICDCLRFDFLFTTVHDYEFTYLLTYSFVCWLNILLKFSHLKDKCSILNEEKHSNYALLIPRKLSFLRDFLLCTPCRLLLLSHNVWIYVTERMSKLKLEIEELSRSEQTAVKSQADDNERVTGKYLK